MFVFPVSLDVWDTYREEGAVPWWYWSALTCSRFDTHLQERFLIIMTAEETVEEIKVIRQPHLAKQDASTVDPSKLTALTPEVVRVCNDTRW